MNVITCSTPRKSLHVWVLTFITNPLPKNTLDKSQEWIIECNRSINLTYLHLNRVLICPSVSLIENNPLSLSQIHNRSVLFPVWLQVVLIVGVFLQSKSKGVPWPYYKDTCIMPFAKILPSIVSLRSKLKFRILMGAFYFILFFFFFVFYWRLLYG